MKKLIQVLTPKKEIIEIVEKYWEDYLSARDTLSTIITVHINDKNDDILGTPAFENYEEKFFIKKQAYDELMKFLKENIVLIGDYFSVNFKEETIDIYEEVNG